MLPSDLKAPILHRVRDLLRPHGYQQSGGLFVRHLPDVTHLVEVQSSRDNTQAGAKFTVNVGVFVSSLESDSAAVPVKPSIARAHWRQRLGRISENQSDLWWHVDEPSKAESAASDICERVQVAALPALERLSSVSDLVRLWQSGASPGVTDFQRRQFLHNLSGGEAGGQSAA